MGIIDDSENAQVGGCQSKEEIQIDDRKKIPRAA
jgi:hypothetical protein